MFNKKIVFSLLLFFTGISACNKDEADPNVLAISKETVSQMKTIISVLNTNTDVYAKILEPNASEDILGTGSNFRGASEEMDPALKAAIEELQKDPNKVLNQIAQETQGAEKISLLEGILTQKDQKTLEQRAEVFVPIDIPVSVSMAKSENLVSSSSNAPYSKNSKINCQGDCKLHVMAGAAIAMGVSALVYAGASWFGWQLKAAMVVVIGVSAGILFGAAKELWDYVRNGNSVNGIHGVEWRDFWNTAIGSSIGGALSFGIMFLIPSPIIASVAMAAGAIFIGWQPIQCCVFKKCGC